VNDKSLTQMIKTLSFDNYLDRQIEEHFAEELEPKFFCDVCEQSTIISEDKACSECGEDYGTSYRICGISFEEPLKALKALSIIKSQKGEKYNV